MTELFEFSASQFALGGLITSIALFVTIGFVGIWMLICPGSRQEKKDEKS